MGQKISTMTELAAINSGDFIEVAEDDGAGGYNTKKYDLADLTTAESSAHTQNTDTGTTSTTFQVDSGNSGPKVKQDSGALYVRNAADGADAAVKAASFKTGTYTLTVDETKSLSDKVDKLLLETSEKTADYTLALADIDKVVLMNKTGAATLTVPTNAAVAFSIGTVIGVYNVSSDAVTIAGDGGVTVRNAGDLAQYGEISLRKRATDEWVLAGAVT